MMPFLFLFMAIGIFIASSFGWWAQLLSIGMVVCAFLFTKQRYVRASALMLLCGGVVGPLSEVSVQIGKDGEADSSTMIAVRNYCMEKLSQTGLDERSIGIAEGCLFGYKDNIDKDIKEDFRHAGMSHLLAVSGLHVGLVMMAIFFLLSPIVFVSHGDSILRFLTIIGVWLYVLLVGAPPSACRAAMMLSLVLAGYLFERYGNEWDAWGFSGICLLVYDSSLLWNLGFQLSYLATGGIFVVLPRIRFGSRRLVESMRRKPNTKKWWITPYLGLRSAIYVSVAAQLATTPIVLYKLHTMPFLGMLQGILVVPVMPMLMIVLFFLLASSLIGIPILVTGLSWAARLIIGYMSYMAHKVAWLDEFVIGGRIWVNPSVFETCLIAIVSWGLLFLLAYRSETEKSQVFC